MSDPNIIDPSVPTAAYSVMSSKWNKIDTVLQGTEAMRRAGERFLPRHEAERSKVYEERRTRATLLNLSEMTLNEWTGQPFSEKVSREDVPEALDAILDDIDLQGNCVDVVARNWFRVGLAKGFAHILIDMPALDRSRLRTKAEDIAENRRPFWSLIQPENLIAAFAETISGQEVLTHVRIQEFETVRQGFDEVTTRRIRVFDRVLPGATVGPVGASNLIEPGVYWSLWEHRQIGAGSYQWTMIVAPTAIDVPEIPIVTFYADRQGLLLAKPPIEDLVDLNIAWWQSNADQLHSLTVARFPILAVAGATEDDSNPIKIGPDKILSTSDPSGKWYFVEHTGAALAAGDRHLESLENQMANYGAEFLRKKPGSETATARALDAAESTSPLEDSVQRFNDALARAMYLTGEWMGIEKVGTMAVSTDVGPEAGTDQGVLAAIMKARETRNISRLTLLEEYKRRGVLAPEFDPEEDMERLEEEDFDATPTDGKPIDPFAEKEEDEEETEE